jgi:succinate dehydrogenase/fumarate reductase cytochrome b subunit (b558 family)
MHVTTNEAGEPRGRDDARRARRAFVLGRLHSLSGVVPLGAFLVEHLWTNAHALSGRASFDGAVARIQALPGLLALEVFGIFLPLAFHAGYGLYLTARGRPNALSYPYAKNWLYVLQRVTGVFALVFIAFHLWEFRVQTWLFGMAPETFYTALEAGLGETPGGVPVRALAYLAGLAAVVFHFANGLVGFAATWGLAGSRAAQRRIAYLFSALGVGLFFVGASTIVHFATGVRVSLVPGSASGANEPLPLEPRVACPPTGP